MLRVYLDICALKRPWDDQSQERVAGETLHVTSIVAAAERGACVVLRSPTHDAENDRNSDPKRAAAIRRWLSMMPEQTATPLELPARVRYLVNHGLKPFDALHLA